MQHLPFRIRIVFQMLALLAMLSSALAVTHVWQGGVSEDWFDKDNWDQGSVPGPGADVSISAGTPKAPTLTNATAALASFGLTTNQTLTVMGWDSALSAVEMTLAGTITHASNSLATTNELGVWVPLHRVWLVGSNITLSAKGKIDASYRGYTTNAGPARGNYIAAGNCSPGHSGSGRRGFAGGTGGPEWGDPAAPLDPGSGGSLHANSGSGGGAIRIEAAGQLTVDGSITAHGRNALGTHGSGAAGGSIWLTCRTLQGSTNGLIGTDGGYGNYYGAGASAGRIAVHYDATAQGGLGTPFPAIRFSGRPGARGGSTEYLLPAMATLYATDTQLVSAAFSGKRFQHTRWIIPGFTNWAVDSLTVNDCVIGLPIGLHVNVAGDLLLTNGAALHVFAAPVDNPLTEDGAVVEVGGNLLISTNTWIHPYADPTNGGVVKIAVTGDVVVAAGGGIDADYKGFTFGKGPGAPAADRGGGAYGAVGGQGYSGTAAGKPYGLEAGPIQAGSGGGVPASTVSCQGGGALRLVTHGRAVIHGTLTASGSPGIGNHGAGGSGGGISLTCRTFEGSASGLIRVDGGLGSYYGGSGSGGRIVLAYDPAAQGALPDPRPPVRFSAYAYPYSAAAYFYPNPAEMGTLWFPDTTLLSATPASAALWTNRQFWHVRLAVQGLAGWAPASLSVSNCVVRFPEGFHLDVAGDVTVQNGAVLRLDAAPTNDPAIFYGALLDVGRTLWIQTNGWLTLAAHPVNGALPGVRVAGDAIIDGGGGVNADELGYCSGIGNTNGPGAGRDSVSAGGHGGKGGGAAGGYAYGLDVMPFHAGSPGGWRGSQGNGGGGIHLLVGGELTMNGTLSAHGGLGQYYRGAGGSGGSILVAARRVTGAGVMRARGGGCNETASGGGGRIAVWDRVSPARAQGLLALRSVKFLNRLETLDSFTGSLQAEGGSLYSAGDPGTAGFYRYALSGTLLMVQ